jgi:pyruvate dehydrogenase E2 component (dihydrolipoamide acetyltransferase)
MNDIYMPQLSLTMTDGKVVNWLKKEGDPVKKGEPVVEVETDKATVELEAPAGGILGAIVAPVGTVVPIGGQLSVVLDLDSRTTSQNATKTEDTRASIRQAQRVIASPRARKTAQEMTIDITQVKASGPGGRIVEADVLWHANEEARAGKPVFISPVAQRIAKEEGVDLGTVVGTGRGGRIMKEDILYAKIPLPADSRETGTKESVSRIHQIMAQRMAESWTSAPHFYLLREIRAEQLVSLRKNLLDAIEKKYNLKLTFTDLLIRMVSGVLRSHPRLNSSWVENELLLHDQINIGVAVAVDDGLVVPVIHNADMLNVGEIAKQRQVLVEKANEGKLHPQDLSGGTFTLSNLGMYNIDSFYAVLNTNQSAILAVGSITDRVIPVAGQPAVRPTMFATLTCDHRAVDGACGAKFLDELADTIENPSLLL